jgi:hypothetical protein
MTGKFQVLIGGVVNTYNHIDDIPMSFDNLIAFEPDFPSEPHTQEEHDLIDTFHAKFKEIFSRERL